MSRISYNIGGTFDPSALNSVKSSLSSLGKVAGTVNTVLKGFVVAKGIGAVKDLAAGSMNAFEDAQVSSSRLFQSVKTNSNLSAGAFKRLSDAADVFQKKSMFDADDIRAGQAYLSTLKLNEQQIQDVTTTAQDMAASGIMPLDKAFEVLGKTYTGTAGQLGKMNGNIKDLTKEQLKHGEAVKLVAKQYAGYSAAISNTPLGQTQRLKIAMGDIKETLGQIPAGLQNLAFDKLLSGATNLKEKLNEGINVFFIALENMPEAGRIVFDAIGKMFAKVFSWDFIGQVLTVRCEQIGRMFTALFDGIKKGFSAIWETAAFNKDLKVQIEGATKEYNIASGNREEKDQELSKKGIQQFDWNKPGAPENPEWAKQMAQVNATLLAAQKKLDGLNAIEQKGYAAAVWQGISTSLTEAASGTQQSLEEVGKILDKNFSEILKGIVVKIKLLSPDGKSKTYGEINSTEPDAQDNPDPVPQSFSSKLLDGFGGLDSIFKMFGQLGTVIKGIISNNPIGIIVQAIMAFVSMFTKIENVSKILNLFDTIFERTGEIIEPIVNNVFAPLVDVLNMIGECIGVFLSPILETLSNILKPIADILSVVLQVVSPILAFVGKILGAFISLNPALILFSTVLTILGNTIAWIFNKILSPIINFVMFIVTGVGNMIIGIYNKVVSVLRSIDIFGWRPFGGMSSINTLDYDTYKLSEITMSTGNTATNTSTSSSASYTAAKDIYINIYYNQSYINGDARQIALNLRNEIKAAEALGY